MFITGIALMAAASLLGGLAQNSTELIAARVGQGLATALTTPAALALLVTPSRKVGCGSVRSA